MSDPARTAAALSAGLLLVPGLEAQTSATIKTPAQLKSIYVKFTGNFIKYDRSLELLGVLNGVPVYRTPKGELFLVDPGTGNLRFLGEQSFVIKFWKAPSLTTEIKWDFVKLADKHGEKLSLVGVDMEGRNVHQNLKGERFCLGPNGDLVFVK